MASTLSASLKQRARARLCWARARQARGGGAMSKDEQPRALDQALQKSFATRWTPREGDFSFRDFGHAPSDKNLSKNGSADKGGSLCVKDVFAKKFLVPGEDPAVGTSASA